MAPTELAVSFKHLLGSWGFQLRSLRASRGVQLALQKTRVSAQNLSGASQPTKQLLGRKIFCTHVADGLPSTAAVQQPRRSWCCQTAGPKTASCVAPWCPSLGVFADQRRPPERCSGPTGSRTVPPTRCDTAPSVVPGRCPQLREKLALPPSLGGRGRSP